FCVIPFALSPLAHAQSRFATSVVSFTQGAGTGTFVPTNALGGPRGAGLTSAFDVTIADGPGADLSVFENPFTFSNQVFSEVAYVEVSTDGVHFARFPSSYAGPSTPLPGFTAPWGTYAGLTGCIP